MLNLSLEPLIQQVKTFTQAQEKTNQILTEILTELKQNKKLCPTSKI